MNHRNAVLALSASFWAAACGAGQDAEPWQPLPTGTAPHVPAPAQGPSSGTPTVGATGPAPSLPGVNVGGETGDASSSAAVTTTPSTTPTESALSARTWRLTHEQYQKTISQVFGVEVDLSNFAPETGNGKFVNFSSTAFVRLDLASNYLRTAKFVASQLTREKLAALTSCALTTDCSDVFIRQLGRKLFRRPVPDSVAAEYEALFEEATASNEPDAVDLGYRAVVATMLASPLFLYRTEVGSEADERRAEFDLTSHEIAAELSFSLTGQAPPPWLADVADAGDLRDGPTLDAAVTRLLEDPAANAELARFLTEWLEVHDFLEVSKSEEVFPGFESAKAAMMRELTAFLSENGQQSSHLVDLLQGNIPEVSPDLTRYYFSDPSAPLDRASTNRQGVLGLGAVLSDHAKSYLTSPTLRGTFVRKRFFCQEITLPPDFTPPPLSETEALKSARTTRELYEQHQADPTCAPCHDLTDNIGFVLEEFDGAGRIRTLDTTQGAAEPVALDAPLTSSDVDRPMASLVDLNAALAESQIVRQCIARQAFRFYFGQGETSTALGPIARGSEAVANATLGDLLAGLFTTESTYRRIRETNQ